MSITKKSSQFSPEEEINRNNKSIEKKKMRSLFSQDIVEIKNNLCTI